MQFRRCLIGTVVPVAITAACAGPALAATTQVGVRVEGTSHTLLSQRTVTAPSTGSITKGSTPSGVCPATSAAGALTAATHGNWDGTYSSGLGIEVTDILGTRALYAQGSYWEFFVNDRSATEGVCDTTLKPGEQLLFAQVPAKGKAELPIVVSAPKTVTAGKPFDVKTFVYSGKGNATTPVTTAHFLSHGASVKATRTRTRGTWRLSEATPGTKTLVVSAAGDIRSTPVTVKVTR